MFENLLYEDIVGSIENDTKKKPMRDSILEKYVRIYLAITQYYEFRDLYDKTVSNRVSFLGRNIIIITAIREALYDILLYDLGYSKAEIIFAEHNEKEKRCKDNPTIVDALDNMNYAIDYLKQIISRM